MTLLASAPLVALSFVNNALEDGSTDSQRTLFGAIGILLVIALVIGIGQFMTGSARSSR